MKDNLVQFPTAPQQRSYLTVEELIRQHQLSRQQEQDKIKQRVQNILNQVKKGRES
ncbi:MAG TPA: hypothetical protein VFV52_12065 [Bacilli bacterium]|nr:hypothetical protein [Bacilli bacterium]